MQVQYLYDGLCPVDLSGQDTGFVNNFFPLSFGSLVPSWPFTTVKKANEAIKLHHLQVTTFILLLPMTKPHLWKLLSTFSHAKRHTKTKIQKSIFVFTSSHTRSQCRLANISVTQRVRAVVSGVAKNTNSLRNFSHPSLRMLKNYMVFPIPPVTVMDQSESGTVFICHVIRNLQSDAATFQSISKNGGQNTSFI